MATDVIKEEFVTIVPVGEGRPVTRDPSFVTVLTVGAALGAAEIVVRRPRGARLGLGLKFEGGSAAAEKVRRLLVQSCAEDSPAAKAVSPWGKLIPGDEILAIDGISVSELTRIDCVRRLKDSDENLILLVRHFETEEVDEKVGDVIDSVPSPKHIELLRPSLPPPVPPRKLGKKNSFKDKCLQSLIEQNINVNSEKEGKTIMQQVLSSNFNNKLSRKSSFDSHILRQNKESIACLKKGSPEEVRRLVRRLSDGKTMPPEAEVYIDLLSNEWERCLALADAESDDTGSSISTVVDRLSSMASSVENSIPSTPIMQPKAIDIKRVLNCIENIDSDILKDITSNNFIDNSLNIKSEVKLEKTIYTNVSSLSQTDNENINEGAVSCEVNGKLQNDKNNNTTTVQNITLINLMNESNDPIKIPDVKLETHPGKSIPTPMPRNVKSESTSLEKDNKISIDNSETGSTDILLTPTKKNCIESWLMRSEAEMYVKNEEDTLDDTTVLEVLPRLIDFVPKPQFKESVSEGTLNRPTSAPPPPPVETREDGSGASLDTIGELDETADSSLTEKSINSSEKNKDEKSACDPTFWDDSVNKSESEDKSLSNDESPLPSCPRQPPDGVETPSDVLEKIPDTPVNRLPPRLPQGWPTTRSRVSYSRLQDARSEASVKDKIAMFSHDQATSTDRLDKCGTLPSRNTSVVPKVSNSYMDNYTDLKSLDRRLTKSQDNLDDVPRSYKRHSERPEALGALENTSLLNSNSTNKNSKELSLHETKPLFYGSTNTLPSSNINSTYTPQMYHARSNSDDSTKGSQKLEYLIEQRKKSTSKLRALMIPETQAPIIDLPEIKVDNRLPTSFASDVSYKSSTQSKSNQPKKTSSNCINLKDSWKTNTLPNNIPKYSPAFKRKSLQIYPTVPLLKEISPEPKLSEDSNYSSCLRSANKLTPLKPPRQSLDIKHLSDKSTCYSTLPMKGVSANPPKLYKEYKNISDIRDYSNMEIKICTITDVVDSDNDSAMSSTQSSYRSSASSPLHNLDSIESDSSHLSPKITHYNSYGTGKSPPPMKSLVSKNSLDYEKRNVCRSVSSDTNVSISSSAGSAATSGSQASCSSLESSINDDKKRVSKVYDIDTINRKNILASAKCRSGRDAKLNSPVVETKFSHDNYDRSTGSSNIVPERLSTLTSTVSAVSSKGETRRRNKVIAASDSDTDNEINIRQRKAEYKNSRLKRNSSNSKTKQNDNNIISTDKTKNIEEAPQVISERIIKEIKKAGLDNYHTIPKPILQKNTIETTEIIRTNLNSKYEQDNINSKTVSSPVVNSKRVTDKKILENGKSKPNAVDKNEDDNNKYTTHIVQLKKGAGAGVGLILAGGIDCEAKNVTVHRVLADSIAQRAGLKRGARVRSINGCPMAGLTHAQSVAILKEQRSEILIEIENEIQNSDIRATSGSKNESKVRHSPATVVPEVRNIKEKRESGNLVTVVLEKAGKAGGTGLGFSIEGGRDSSEGGPLVIKKLFQGAVAEQSGCVRVGAELLSAGGQQLEGYTRFQAWDFLKSLPVGPVTLVLRNPST